MRWSQGAAQLRVATASEDEPTDVPILGLRLCFDVPEEASRRCVGYVDRDGDGSRTVTCRRVPKQGRRCASCQRADTAASVNMNQSHRRGRGAIDGRMVAYLEQPHRLYVAGFRDGSLKVGTAAGTSDDRRLLEQGAWLARYVGEAPDGFVVRQAEDMVTSRTGLAQGVTVARKLRGLTRPVDDDVLAGQLDEATQGAAEVARSSGIEVTVASWSNPARSAAIWSGVLSYPATVDAGSHDLTFLGAVGRLLAAVRPGFDEVFVVDPAPLFGRAIDLGEHRPDEVALQAALF